MLIIKDTKGVKLAAIVLAGEPFGQAINFVTDSSDPLQVGILCHEDGTVLKPHIHLVKKVGEVMTMEVVYVVSGKVKCCVFDSRGTLIQDEVLRPGDLFVQFSGGHSFQMLKKARLIEVKQGPYLDHDSDKRML
jgi:cupin fold WbuC family metalloprotein